MTLRSSGLRKSPLDIMASTSAPVYKDGSGDGQKLKVVFLERWGVPIATVVTLHGVNFTFSGSRLPSVYTYKVNYHAKATMLATEIAMEVRNSNSALETNLLIICL
ncbi:hypothetical protein EYC80_005417 [Monilinia laxa]|uniref:Uncharacterized protein n=1 Tax=Monilinia laxa TaxID=61186 RepID=A0A5N6KK79_MONLA|nr:hypothetical protein EYC80_005417 [Monilinia laxa]